MDSSDPKQEQALDPEWIELISLAKMMGFTIEELRIFITSKNLQNN
ncbi:anti-repressor SinI family protein [Desulfosporosinus sp. OT]|nr:anti-repressor SinI family protein [Desulfosporosinus sp. OT]